MDEKAVNKFSQGYLWDCFDSNYKAGLAAVKRNNLGLAKEKFITAAEYMDKLALAGSDENKAERIQRAKRLREIADSIDDVQSSGNVNTFSSQNNQFNTQGEALGSEMEQYLTFYSADQLKFGFEGVVGLEQAKTAVKNYVVLPYRYPDAYNYNFLDNKALLLEGPPGTGKTTFAKAVAKEIQQPFAIINVAALVNCYIGETGKNIDKIFEYLRRYAEQHNCGITVFIDEFDEIAKTRGSDDKVSEAAVPALLRNLDGIKDNKNFLIIANTNRKDMLDSAILERFRKQIYIPLPDKTMRIKLFKDKLSDVEQNFINRLDFNEIGAVSDGLSGRDITFICDDFKYFLAQIKAGVRKDNGLMSYIFDLIRTRVENKKLL